MFDRTSIIVGLRDLGRSGWHDIERPLNKGQGHSFWYQSIWRLTIKTDTGALYKVFSLHVQSELLYTEQSNVMEYPKLAEGLSIQERL